MSVQAIAWVLEESRAEGFDRLVLLAIANHVDGREWQAWPSVAQIAHEARVSRRTVFRCLLELKALGELEVTEGGHGRGQTNLYRIPRLPEKGCQEECHADTLSPEKGAVRVSGSTEKGDTAGTRNRQEPGTRVRTRVREGAAPSPTAPPLGAEEEKTTHRPRYHQPFTPDPPVTEEERALARARVRALRTGEGAGG